MKSKLLVYLGDLDHFVEGNKISVPLNIASIASYCKNLLDDAVDIKLFKDPEKLMKEIEKCQPHVLGLSYYMWNTKLTQEVVKSTKSISPSTITLIGGSSVPRNIDRYKEVLDSNLCLDIVILDQAEKSFSKLLNIILSKGIDKLFFESIPGCASRLKGSNKIVRGQIVYPEDNKEFLNEFPSPYLMGYLDPFLEAGFFPLLETTRGCPYSCTYCGQGDVFFSKLHVKDEEIVYKELLHILRHAVDKRLCITDSNFGIMGERDKRIAIFMSGLYKKYNSPFLTDCASSKLKTRESIETMKVIAKNITGYFYLGLQSLTTKVLENCKRENPSEDVIRSLSSMSKEEDLAINVDLIFGLPGETAQSFLKTISQVLSIGVDQSGIYNLRLLPGSELSEHERERYNYKTRFRPINNRYGEYELVSGIKPVRIIELEEIAYGCDSFDESDFMRVRKYGFLFELLISYSSLSKTMIFLNSRGINISKIFEVILEKTNSSPQLSNLLKDYDRFSRGELFENEEELINNISKDDTKWADLLMHRGQFFKINLGFVGYCLFENNSALRDIESIIIDYVSRKAQPCELENVKETIKYDRFRRIFFDKREERFDISGIKKEVCVKHLYDYKKWTSNGYRGNLKDYKYPRAMDFIYYINRYDDLINTIEGLNNFFGFNLYEKILMRTSPSNLKRWVRRP